jgi:glycerol-3-phosphate acyltransferase PlsY
MTLLAAISPQNSFPARLFYLKIDGLIVIMSYLLGSIPFGYLIAKSRGIDIRQHGSGNIGATNVMRTLGKGPGYTAFACDVLKGLIAVLIAKHIAHGPPLIVTEARQVGGAIYHSTYVVTLPESIAAISAAIVCIIGHNFPVWLGFKGGKGMATSAGVLFGMIPMTAITCMAIWAVVFLATRYVSLASIAASIALPLVTMIFLVFGLIHGWPYFYFTVAACILAVWRHRSNIVRLLNGTENRFEKKPKPEPPAQ